MSHIVENDGFTKIGVNRIANQAGCDKVLIYRYFGGLDGLLVEWAKRHDYYSFAYSEFIDTIKRAKDGNIKQIVKDVLMCQLNYLKIMYSCKNFWYGNFQVIHLSREL